jgi:DNA-binding NarL/FixJ family response regulator
MTEVLDSMLRVVVVEDSKVVRERLLLSIESIPNIQVVGEYEDEEAAVAGLQQLTPDILLLDIRLRTGSGINVLKEMAGKYPYTKILVLTNYTEPQYRKTCLENGAHYFFDKSSEFEQVPKVIAQLAAGLK